MSTPGTDVKFERWWDKNDMDSVPDADFTFGEEVWKVARKELLREQRKRKAKKSDS